MYIRSTKLFGVISCLQFVYFLKKIRLQKRVCSGSAATLAGARQPCVLFRRLRVVFSYKDSLDAVSPSVMGPLLVVADSLADGYVQEP